ncbi:MAG: putative HTH-type transcriptional regulator [Candidatus Woesearchaeota archaeon]|nr:putative HTH-type transcriptional regulator [Candidatus Woesearchaeota archaeon]
MEIDEKDRKIIQALKQDSSRTTSKISKLTKIPITTVHNRIKKLEKNNIISGYTIQLNHELLGEDILVYILVSVKYTTKEMSQEKIAKRIKQNKCVEEVNIITGDNDMMVKARFNSISNLNKFITNDLRNIKGVDKTKTLVVLDEV